MAIDINLQKWYQQPTSTSGYQQPHQFGFEVLTTLMPQVVIGQPGTWRIIETDKPTYAFPRGKRNDASTIKRNVKLGTPLSFDYTSGEYETVKITHQLAIAQVFQNFEIMSTGTDYVGFRMAEAIAEMAREYERIAIDDLVTRGTAGTVKYKADAKTADVFATINEAVTQMNLNGSEEGNIVIYMTPELWQKLYTDGLIMANGVGNIPATDIRQGFAGYILGYPILKAPRLSSRWHTFAAGQEANMILVDRSQVIMLRYMVEPVVMKRAPTDYPADCTFLTCLEYVEHYLVNSNGVYYLNVVDIA